MKNDRFFLLKKLNQLTYGDSHDAFCDLAIFNGRLFCCFRRATNHVSRDGRIIILCIDKTGKKLFSQQINLPSTDLRDPKLSVTPSGELIMLAYARVTDQNNQTRSTQNLIWRSQNGESWSAPRSLGLPFWWLWRIRWLNNNRDVAGFAYNRNANRIDFYKGNPMQLLEQVKRGALSLSQHGLGYPNESDLYCLEDGTVHAIIRRDADSFSAQFGISKPPYTHWHWHDLNLYIGGPVMVPFNETHYLIGGRAWTGRELVTRLWLFNWTTRHFFEVDTLPSGGDNSYPGITIENDTCWVSYYSSHIDNRTNIYLAEYDIKTFKENRITINQ